MTDTARTCCSRSARAYAPEWGVSVSDGSVTQVESSMVAERLARNVSGQVVRWVDGGWVRL